MLSDVVETVKNLGDSYGIPEKCSQFSFIDHQFPSQGWCKARTERREEEKKKASRTCLLLQS
jgi:hypothetical protein